MRERENERERRTRKREKEFRQCGRERVLIPEPRKLSKRESSETSSNWPVHSRFGFRV
jgi:hypothetical protein